MAIYKHGTYGEFAQSVGQTATQTATTAVYVGAAPVNLIRGYADAGIVNRPIKLESMAAAKSLMGYSDAWGSFSLCEAFKAHFDNGAGNVGPIVAINVLDPAIHKKEPETTTPITFTNGQATIHSDTIILDTLVLADKVEGKDFTISYDFDRSMVIISSIGETKITGQINVTYSEVDPSKVVADQIIGGVTSAGIYSGLGAVPLVYQDIGLIPNVIAAPGWSEDPKVYAAMINAGTKINGHWDAMAIADIPLVGTGKTPVDTIDKAKSWKAENGYTNERTKVCWPQAKAQGGELYHISTLTVVNMQAVDATHDGVPMETPSNKAVPIVQQYFGDNATNAGFDQMAANALNADGITTVCFFGGLWVLWGPHTAAYKHGSVSDSRAIFDNSLRMMMHITNSFQQEWASTIDKPMTRALADTIKNREQEKLDALAAIGALIGEPSVRFVESANPISEITEGNFIWDSLVTPTPPWKSGTMRVSYSTAGFTIYSGEGA